MAGVKKTTALPATVKNTQGGALTTYEERMAAKAKAAVATEASVGTGNAISTRAGVLSFNGQPFKGNKFNAIVVDYVLENNYYGRSFDPDNPQPPVCFAFGASGTDEDELKPHEKSSDPQAASCKECQWNKFKTAVKQDGTPGKGKACKNSRKLGLLSVATDKQGNMDLDPDVVKEQEHATLKLPVTSVRAWAKYVRTLEVLEQRPPAGVVTEISAVPDQDDAFHICFEHVVTLPAEVGMAVLDLEPMVAEALMVPYSEPDQDKEEFAPQPKGKAAPAAKPGQSTRRKF